MNYHMTSEMAIRLVLTVLDLSDTDIRIEHIIQQDGLYELSLRTVFLRYELYLDVSTGEILGINTEPVIDNETAYALCRVS